MVAAGLLLAAVVGLGARSGGTEPYRTAAPTPQGSAVPALPNSPAPRTGLAAAAVAAGDAVATTTPGVTLGVAVRDRATGETAVGTSGALPTHSASLAKIIIVIDVLQRRRTGLAVGPQDLELIRRALGPSDDQAMNTLWVRFDGPAAIGRVAAQLGLRETGAPHDPSQWGEAVISARDGVTLYDHVLTAMEAEDRELIIGTLAAAPPVATDGFDQEFGLLAGVPSGSVAAKQGWMCCLDGRIALHSTGVLHPERRFVVALLSTHPREVGYAGARETLTAVADSVRSPLP